MASKSGLEHKVKHLSMSSSTPSRVSAKIERLCDEMQEEGWTLRTVSWPSERKAVLVFFRPRASKETG